MQGDRKLEELNYKPLPSTNALVITLNTRGQAIFFPQFGITIAITNRESDKMRVMVAAHEEIKIQRVDCHWKGNMLVGIRDLIKKEV